MQRTSLLAVVLATLQTGCIVAGGYSSNGGWYIWPGSLVSIIVVIAVLFLLNKRRK
jgi:hypothetical protein